MQRVAPLFCVKPGIYKLWVMGVNVFDLLGLEVLGILDLHAVVQYLLYMQ